MLILGRISLACRSCLPSFWNHSTKKGHLFNTCFIEFLDASVQKMVTKNLAAPLNQRKEERELEREPEWEPEQEMER